MLAPVVYWRQDGVPCRRSTEAFHDQNNNNKKIAMNFDRIFYIWFAVLSGATTITLTVMFLV